MFLPLALVLLRISHSMEALDSDLIGTVGQDHTKPLFQFGTELELSALEVGGIIISLGHHFSPKFSQYSWLTGSCTN